MEKIDFIELATFCSNRFKDSLTQETVRYVGTLYVSISEDNQVQVSSTPHILKNAHQCILVHKKRQLAVTNWYSWYTIEYINPEGCVSNSIIDDHFSINSYTCGSFSNQSISLDYDKESLYICKEPYDNKIEKIWKLYTKVKDLKSKAEIMLVADLYMRDETIIEKERIIQDFTFQNQLLEKERDQYKDLLNEVKKLIDSNSKNN